MELKHILPNSPSSLQASWNEYEAKIDNDPPATILRTSGRNVDWDNFIDPKNPGIVENLSMIPPVESFKGVPLSDIWKDIAVVGQYVELRNPFAMVSEDVYWIAKIILFAGYKALVKFESFCDEQSNYLTWISFCSNVPKRLGWCKKNSRLLFPGPIVPGHIQLQSKVDEFYRSKPPTIRPDHVHSLRKELLGMRTVNCSFPVECLDVKFTVHGLHHNRLARICTILTDRVYVHYYDDKEQLDTSKGFWFSYKSDSIHPFGWSHSVGVFLSGNPRNIRRTPLPPSSFPPWPSDRIKIEKEMRLEIRHPVFPNRIVGAKIIKVLNHGYFIAQAMDPIEKYRVLQYFHVTNPFVLPLGFGASHGIKVEFAESRVFLSAIQPLRLELLPPRPPHSFIVGQKFEAVDMLEAKFAGPATIKKVAGHLLFIHFDHWNTEVESNFFWVDSEKSEIYPAGYSEMVGLEYQASV